MLPKCSLLSERLEPYKVGTVASPVGGRGENLRSGAQQAADDLDRDVSQPQADVGPRQKPLQLRHQPTDLAGVQAGHVPGEIQQRVGPTFRCGVLETTAYNRRGLREAGVRTLADDGVSKPDSVVVGLPDVVAVASLAVPVVVGPTLEMAPAVVVLVLVVTFRASVVVFTGEDVTFADVVFSCVVVVAAVFGPAVVNWPAVQNCCSGGRGLFPF